MKKLRNILAITAAIILFYGCPVGIEYPAGTAGTEKIDKSLLGTWVTDKKDHELKRVTIAKNDNYSYTVTVIEKGDSYDVKSDEFAAWVTTIKGKQFIYAKPSNEENKYYLYHYEIKGRKMLTHTVVLNEGIVSVTSTENLRTQIEESLENVNCLSEEAEWTKQ